MSELIALVTEEELRQGKKSPFWMMSLRSVNNTFKCIIWDIDDPNSKDIPHKSDIIKIDLKHEGTKDQRDSKYNNMVISKGGFTKLTKEETPKDILDKIFNIPKASDAQLERAYKILTDKSMYQDVNSFAFVMAVLASLPKKDLFTCPAGKSVHHAFQGGLIVHTAEVVQICRGIMAGMPYNNLIDQDVVFAGATLHDIGKVITYGNDELGQPTVGFQEKTIGHLYYSMSIIEKVGLERKVDRGFLDEVLHVVASHHNRPEFGAIKEPATMEALVVSQADFLGSRIGMLEAKLTPMKSNKQELESEYKAYGQTFIFGRAIKRWFNA